MSKDKSGWNKYRRGPVRKDANTITLSIDSLGNNGEGIGRHAGQVVFVPATLPGERVTAKVNVRKKNLIKAQLSDILTASPERQTPPCQWFGECGGCDWQHVPYPMQLQTKTGHLSDALQRIGHLQDVPIAAMVASPQPYAYRNRIQGVIKNGQFHYRARGSDQLVKVSQCAIAEPAINQRLAESLADCPEGRVELAVQDNGVSILPLNELSSTQAGFRQVNTALSEHLRIMLEDIATRYSGKRCIDLYCGRGNWSIAMARRHPEMSITGVDVSEDNIRAARQNALDTGLVNVRFQHGRVEKLLESLTLKNSFCIVDPPRAGLATDVCNVLCNNPPDHLVYISCHPASLARDLAILTRTQFSIDSVTPLDMFPQTAHLECLAVLTGNSHSAP